MKKRNGSVTKDFNEALGTVRTVSYVFLGVGLSLFLLNISSFLAFLPSRYSAVAFDLSVFSSMIIVIYSVYILHHYK